MINTNLHKKILNVFAVALIIIVFANTLINFFYWNDGWTEILWYCSLASLVLSAGILLKNSYLNSIVLTTAIPAQFFWILDFVLKLVGMDGFGRTGWLFEWPFITIFLSIVLHVVLIPLAIYSVWVYGFKKKSLLFTFIFIIVCMVLPFLFSAYDDNVNCVFYSCDLNFDEAINTTSPMFMLGSVSYLGFITLRWLAWSIIIYFGLILLFQRVFKRIKIV